MMMLDAMIKKFAIPLMICFLPAGMCLAGTAGWSDYGRVLALQATTHGRFLVRLELPANPSGCRDKDWFYRDYGGEGPEYMYQTLLTALTMDKPVQVYVTGVCDLNGYAEITTVRIAP
jgi:hypothetical protein